MTRASLAIIALALAATTARAEPQHVCAVHVARAPAAIRAEIERWLAGESSCNVALEVRVVPTDGGFYLLARDVRGRVRERIVPDGASAGVLVASWASDDQLGDNDAPPSVPRPAALERDGDDDGSDDNSDAIVVPTAAIVAHDTTPVAPAESKWLRFAVIGNVAGVGGTGARGEVDVWQRSGWSTGLAASITSDATAVPDAVADAAMPITLRDIDALAYIGRTVNLASWLHVRGAFGAGMRITTASVEYLPDADGMASGPASASGVRPLVDVSLLVGAELGYGWALEFGARLSAVTQMTETLSTMSYYGTTDVEQLELDASVGLQLFGGIAHRL